MTREAPRPVPLGAVKPEPPPEPPMRQGGWYPPAVTEPPSAPPAPPPPPGQQLSNETARLERLEQRVEKLEIKYQNHLLRLAKWVDKVEEQIVHAD